MCPGVVPVLLFADGAELAGQRWRHFVLHGDRFQAAPAGPGAARVEGPLVIQLVGDREIDGFRGFDFQFGVKLAAAERADQGRVDLGVAFELVVDHRVVGQAQARLVGGLNQDADVVADGSVVALDLHFTIVAARGERVDGVGAQFAFDFVNGRAETDRDLVVEGIADSRLEGDDFNVAFLAPVAAGSFVLILGHQAERGVDTEANAPVLIDGLDVEAHRNAHERNHVTVGRTAREAAARDIGLGDHGCGADSDLLTFQARHTGRVAEYGAGIIGRRRTTRETCAHAADTLFVEGKAAGEQLSRGESDGEAERGFEHYFFHY
ncbi:hypothetical protein D3C79_713390 [compost metagenome]